MSSNVIFLHSLIHICVVRGYQNWKQNNVRCFTFIFTNKDQREGDAEPSADGTEVGASVTLKGIWQHQRPLPASCAKTPASLAKRGFHQETLYPLRLPSGLHHNFPSPLFSSQTSSHFLSVHLYHTQSAPHLCFRHSIPHTLCSSPSPYLEHLIPVTGFVLEGFGKSGPLLQTPLPSFPPCFLFLFFILSLSPFLFGFLSIGFLLFIAHYANKGPSFQRAVYP